MVEMRNEEEIKVATIDFTLRILSLHRQRAEIDADVKIVKEEAKSNGVAVAALMKAVAKIKRDMKKSDGEKFEEESLYEMLKNCPEIENAIAEINNI